MSTKINWDALGIATSVACAIHCAILPVLITTLPFFGINILHNAFFEWGMITLACLIGSFLFAARVQETSSFFNAFVHLPDRIYFFGAETILCFAGVLFSGSCSYSYCNGAFLYYRLCPSKRCSQVLNMSFPFFLIISEQKTKTY